MIMIHLQNHSIIKLSIYRFKLKLSIYRFKFRFELGGKRANNQFFHFLPEQRIKRHRTRKFRELPLKITNHTHHKILPINSYTLIYETTVTFVFYAPGRRAQFLSKSNRTTAILQKLKVVLPTNRQYPITACNHWVQSSNLCYPTWIALILNC